MQTAGADEGWRCLWLAGAQLGEGALWSVGDQALWWVDILGRRLHRCDAEGGARRSWAFDEEVSAVAECGGGDGGLLLALRRGVAHFLPFADDAIPRYLHCPPAEPAHNRFNDGKCDAAGRFWAGSMDFDARVPSGVLYRFDPDGRCTRMLDGHVISNGPTWSLDGRTLYFNDTAGARTLAFAFDPASGELSQRRVWRQWEPDRDGLPDGMCTDAAGRIWVAHWGGGCVTAHDPADGAELQRIALPASQITSCTFGGPDLRTLFVTSARTELDADRLAAEPLAGALFAVALEVPGLPAQRFGGPR